MAREQGQLEPERRRVLVADGDLKSLRILDVTLRKEGYQVETAFDGAEALSMIEANPPDLILADTELAQLDGFELCRRVKADPERAQIPFVFVASPKVEDRIRGIEIGADEYLPKPIYVREVVGRVRMLLERQARTRLESGPQAVAGRLSDVPMVDLLQMIEANRRSGIVRLSAERDNARGELYFRQGKVVDAEAGRLSGKDAAFRLFSWTDGRFEIEYKSIRRKDVLGLSTAALIMDGLRRQEEWSGLQQAMPPPDTIFEVDFPVLAERLAEIPDEVNALLRLFDGKRTVEQIIDDCGLSDIDALTVVGKLYGEGVIRSAGAARRSEPPPAAETQPEPPVAPQSRMVVPEPQAPPAGEAQLGAAVLDEQLEVPSDDPYGGFDRPEHFAGVPALSDGAALDGAALDGAANDGLDEQPPLPAESRPEDGAAGLGAAPSGEAGTDLLWPELQGVLSDTLLGDEGARVTEPGLGPMVPPPEGEEAQASAGEKAPPAASDQPQEETAAEEPSQGHDQVPTVPQGAAAVSEPRSARISRPFSTGEAHDELGLPHHRRGALLVGGAAIFLLGGLWALQKARAPHQREVPAVTAPVPAATVPATPAPAPAAPTEALAPDTAPAEERTPAAPSPAQPSESAASPRSRPAPAREAPGGASSPGEAVETARKPPAAPEPSVPAAAKKGPEPSVPAAAKKGPEPSGAQASTPAPEGEGASFAKLLETCRTAFDKGRIKEALGACTAAKDANPSSPDALVLLAHTEFNRGKMRNALDWAEKAAELNPGIADAYVIIGGVEQDRGNTKAAKAAYKKYLELAPRGQYAKDLRAIVNSL